MLICLVENLDKVEGEISSEHLNEEKQLARRLALLLGLDGIKNREAVAMMHKQGIQMALGNGRQRVKLLVVLAEFSGKLLKQDRRVVVEFLDREVARNQEEEWEEVAMYRNSLQREVAAGQE